MRIMCIDPGKTTGWCVLDVPEDAPASLLTFGEEPGLPAAIAEIWLKGVRFEVDRLVVETWEYRHGVPTDARHACEPLGMLKYLAWDDGLPVTEQRPGFRITVPDTKKELEPLGLWIPGSTGATKGLRGHARQAMRHGVSYVIHTMKHRPTRQWVTLQGLGT